MAKEKKFNSGAWRWAIIVLLVALIAVSIVYYIGWFDNNDHVDTPAGDNVEQNYPDNSQRAADPGQANWNNSDSRSLDQIIVNPDSQPQNP